MMRTLLGTGWIAVASLFAAGPSDGMPEGTPAAVIDLQTDDGVRAVHGQWRFSPIKIIDSEFGGEKVYDYTPHAGVAGFDDSRWLVLQPAEIRRGHAGRMSFVWYRIKVTIPERIGNVDPAGMTAVLETLVDDYGEIWVDGELPRWQGLVGGPIVAGFLAPNRLVLGRHVKAGQTFEIAIFVMNGPISNVPPNRANMHTAKLQFYRTPPGPVALLPGGYNPDVEQPDRAAAHIFIDNLKLIKLADGFTAAGKPAWDRQGALRFGDPALHESYRYSPNNVCTAPIAAQSRVKTDLQRDDQKDGARAVALDPEGRLTIAEANRVVRLDPGGKRTVLAEQRAEDLIYRSDGTLYFAAAGKIYSLQAGNLRSVDLAEPRGIALSPDESFLYATAAGGVTRYDAGGDGTLSNGKVIAQVESAGGIQIDREGNLYIAAADGLRVLASDGKHLGTMLAGRKPRHLAWGDADAKTLYLTSPEALYCVRLGVAGLQGEKQK
jgi:gluconolactonase